MSTESIIDLTLSFIQSKKFLLINLKKKPDIGLIFNLKFDNFPEIINIFDFLNSGYNQLLQYFKDEFGIYTFDIDYRFQYAIIVCGIPLLLVLLLALPLKEVFFFKGAT